MKVRRAVGIVDSKLTLIPLADLARAVEEWKGKDWKSKTLSSSSANASSAAGTSAQKRKAGSDEAANSTYIIFSREALC